MNLANGYDVGVQRPVAHVSLDRALSKLGAASRSRARDLIRAGQVSVNGSCVRNPFVTVNPQKDRIQIAGKRVRDPEPVYLLLNKPAGSVTSKKDSKNRPLVFDLVPAELGELHAVGRLDMATSGLLFLTNDTRFSSWLTDGENAVTRTYIVEVRGLPVQKELDLLRGGLTIDGEKMKADGVSLQKGSRKESRLEIVLTEGRNREVRRLFEAIGHEVIKLKRIAFGGMELGDLKPGEFRNLSVDDVLKAFPGIRLKRNPV